MRPKFPPLGFAHDISKLLSIVLRACWLVNIEFATTVSLILFLEAQLNWLSPFFNTIHTYSHHSVNHHSPHHKCCHPATIIPSHRSVNHHFLQPSFPSPYFYEAYIRVRSGKHRKRLLGMVQCFDSEGYLLRELLATASRAKSLFALGLPTPSIHLKL